MIQMSEGQRTLFQNDQQTPVCRDSGLTGTLGGLVWVGHNRETVPDMQFYSPICSCSVHSSTIPGSQDMEAAGVRSKGMDKESVV